MLFGQGCRTLSVAVINKRGAMLESGEKSDPGLLPPTRMPIKVARD
jgi:hypothetical protein